MNRCLKIYSLGLLISFLGTLPLGTLNITAFQIAASQNINDALIFAIAVIIVELIAVRITLIGAYKFKLSNKLTLYILPFAIILLIYLAVANFISVGSGHRLETANQFFTMIKSPFLLGLLLSALNPMHIPFWMGWNSALIARKTLDNNPGMYLSYLSGIGIGSIAGLLIFIFAGRLIFERFQQYNSLIALTMGCLYLSFVFYLLYLFYKNHIKKYPIKQLERH